MLLSILLYVSNSLNGNMYSSDVLSSARESDTESLKDNIIT